MKLLTVVVLAGESRTQLQRSLEAARAVLLPPGWRCELFCVVAEHSPQDRALAAAAGAQCIAHPLQTAGRAAACNAALHAAHGHWLLIIQAGQQLSGDVLVRASAQMSAHAGAILVQQPQKVTAGSLAAAARREASDLPPLWSAGIAVLRRMAVLEAGGWDERLSAAAMPDMYRRLLLNGWDVERQSAGVFDFGLGLGRLLSTFRRALPAV